GCGLVGAGGWWGGGGWLSVIVMAHRCRLLAAPDPADLLAIGVTNSEGVELFRGEGCDACRKTGYKGRVGVYELFIITEEVRSLILRKASSGEIRRMAVERGMISLREDAWAKARAGVATLDAMVPVTQRESGGPAGRPSRTAEQIGGGRPSRASWKRPMRAASSSAFSGTRTSPSRSRRSPSGAARSGSACRRSAGGASAAETCSPS